MCSTAAPTATSNSSNNSPPSLVSRQISAKSLHLNHNFHPNALHEALLAGRSLLSAMELKLRCSATGCDCTNFVAAKDRLRTCDGCSHSWITHLFEKLLRDETLSIFDVCSLALYGTHALPIRLKIVIERLLSTLQNEEIDKILRSFGWTSPDLARGYMIQDPRGGLLGRWSMLPREEEILILQQFLRFNPTRSLSFTLLRDDFPSIPQPIQPAPQHQVTTSPPSSQPNDQRFNNKPLPPIPPPPDEPALNLSSGHQNQKKRRGHRKDVEMKNEQSSSEDDEDGDTIHQPPVDLSSKRSSKSDDPPPPTTMAPVAPPPNHKTDMVKGDGGPGGLGTQHHRHHWSNHHGAGATQLVNPTTGTAAATLLRRSVSAMTHPTECPKAVLPVTSCIVLGKRRVQCSVCLKTFCDKGALKIHFSAVHLREMHKCTVAGCNMMFSSRRSRNRHSANPNPKLHSPHLRRRISPHDGRTCQPLLTLNSPLLGALPPGMLPTFTNGVKEEDPEMNNHDDDSESSVSLSSTSEKSAGALPEENRKDGARKRKLSNPVRLPSVRDDSNDDFCCYDDGTEVGGVDNDSHEDDRNHLERLESLPIFNTSSPQSDSGSNDESSPNSTDGDSIPIDKENPRRCIACGKMFQNHFGVKTHYQNVHLKCTVDGCNAAFPSKRSRDRHSANLNLHRKLLSTTSDVSNESSEDPPQPQINPRHHSNIFNPFLVNGTSPSPLNHVTSPPWNPFLPFPLFPGVFHQPPPQHPASGMSLHMSDCRFCGKSFEAGPALQSHMESVHAQEAIRCRHCSALFFSRKKLDNHNCGTGGDRGTSSNTNGN